MRRDDRTVSILANETLCEVVDDDEIILVDDGNSEPRRPGGAFDVARGA
jgi:hypothetical protein